MTSDPEAEAEDKVATLLGEKGEEAQFAATQARSREIVDQRFDLFRFMSGQGAIVHNSQESLISAAE
jgi:hypothetical protein